MTTRRTLMLGALAMLVPAPAQPKPTWEGIKAKIAKPIDTAFVVPRYMQDTPGVEFHHFRIHKLIGDTLATVSKVREEGVTNGTDPAKIEATVKPLVDSAERLMALTNVKAIDIDQQRGYGSTLDAASR